jgi:hypothetical protein
MLSARENEPQLLMVATIYVFKVIPHKFIMDEQSTHYGRVINKKFGQKVCIDHLQRDSG